MTVTRPARRPTARRGLTLIELVVVLTILTALGALLVPIVGNAITRSHLATCLTNFPEVTRMLNTSQAINGTIGDGWTNPVLANGSPAAGFIAGDYGTLTQEEIDALAELGMENFTDLGDDTVPGYNVTFNNGVVRGAGTPLVADTTNVPVLSDDDAENVFLEFAGDEKYVFFAIDKSWSLLGTATPEPPVHFGDAPGSLPDEVYSRFGAIFQVADAAGNPLPVAQFKRVSVHIGEEGLGGAYETADAHSAVYWQEVDSQQ
jgi:prepilin-type N-terminal cleavage/methylation domain-containing protein